MILHSDAIFISARISEYEKPFFSSSYILVFFFSYFPYIYIDAFRLCLDSPSAFVAILFLSFYTLFLSFALLSSSNLSCLFPTLLYIHLPLFFFFPKPFPIYRTLSRLPLCLLNTQMTRYDQGRFAEEWRAWHHKTLSSPLLLWSPLGSSLG